MTGERQTVGRATGLIVLASCAFGSLSTLTVLIAKSGMPLLPAMFWRYLLAALVLLVVLRKKVVCEISRRNALKLMLVGGFGQALITYLSLHALDYLPVGPLAFLFYTYPAWVALLAAISGRENMTFIRIVALAIAMAGIAVMVGTPTAAHLNTTGVIIALGSAFLYALYLPSLNYVQRGISAALSSFYLICGVLTAFFIGNIAMGTLQMPATTGIWEYLLLMSLFSTVIAFASLIAGLRVLGAVRTSIIATIEPFFTALLGAVLLGESLTRLTIAGGALIAGAVVMLQWTARDASVVPAD